MGLACAEWALPTFSYRYSPKKFARHQLVARLTLKEFFKLDYRGVVQRLIDSPGFCANIELPGVPHWAALQKATDQGFEVRACGVSTLWMKCASTGVPRPLNTPARRNQPGFFGC